MGFTPEQGRDMRQRTEEAIRRGKSSSEPMPETEPKPKGIDSELGLHTDIIKFCLSQWPRWKYIHANPVTKSTIQKGCQDFTIFMPGGKTVCIECKDKYDKQRPDQLIWAKEMEMLGHTVYVVRSMEDFNTAIANEKTPSH